ncbi:MAG: PKD domain-containing protein [Candidatus Woesearchaeota archaeon]
MNKILSFIISFVLILTTITAAAALNVDTYFENTEQSIQLSPGQSTNYYIDIIPNSWATSVDVEAILYDDTSVQIVQKQVLFTDTHNSNSFYFSPVLQLTQSDYLYSGDYFIEVKATQTNSGGTKTIRTETLYFTVTGERLFEVDFTFSPNNPFVGDQVSFVSQVNLEGNTVSSYRWLINGNEVSTSKDFNHVFTSPGTYDVTLRVTDSQQRTRQVTKQVVVQQVQLTGPTADFSFSPSSPTSDDTISFTDQSTKGDGEITNYRWRINGQTVSTSKNFNQKLAAGTYQVELRVTDSNNLQDTKTRTVTVTQAAQPVGPTAAFRFTPTNPNNLDNVAFIDESVQGDNPIVSYQWRVDGVVVSNNKAYSRMFTTPGSYQVRLTVTDSIGLSNHITKTVVVSQFVLPVGPTADFTFSPTNPSSDDIVSFTSTSSAGDNPISQYRWRVDGQTVSTSSGFSQKFAAGSYQVELMVTDTTGLVSLKTKTVTVSQAVQPVGPTAEFTFSPSNPTSDDIVSFTSTSSAGDNPISQYRWRVDGQTVSTSSGFSQKFAAGSYQVELRVTDSIGLQHIRTRTITVSQTQLPSLLIDELGCNQNVVQGHIQHCSVHVSSNGQDVANSQVTFKYQGSNQVLGTCTTNNKGYCSINPTINQAPGTYTIYAEASKSGYQPDNSRALTSTFKVWEERYEILNLRLYEDNYVTEQYTFYRANPIYASFSVRDLFTGQTISPNQNLVSEVFLRVNNQNELQFQQDAFTSSQYRYFLPSIPITDDFLGQGRVFSFVFNFNDDTAGQGSVVVNILNNPLTFNPQQSYTLQTNEYVDIDFKQYVSDVETPLNEIVFTFQNLGAMQVTHLSNNVYRFTAPSFATTQTVQVTADDTDGSTVTRPITFNVFELQGPTANFQFSPSEPFVNQLVTFTSTSIQGGAQITNYEWQIDGAQINAQTSQFTWTFGGAQTFNVRLQVTDANGLQDSITKQVVVSEVPLPQLLLEELGCNKNVVQGYNQYCTALVTSEGSPVQDAQVTFVLQDQTFGTCMTNNNGYCKIEPQVNLAAGTYTVRAEASKSGYQPDNSRTLQSTFTVWEYRYDVEQLRVFSDEFVTESDTFYRSDPMYVSFRIRDSFTGQLVTDNDLVKEVFLRVLNQNELHFEEHTHTATEYRYFLPSIPITSDFLGEGKVFSFVFNFNDNTAGQGSVVVNILNNPLTFNPQQSYTLQTNEYVDIDFKQYVSDVETPLNEIVFTFQNLGAMQVTHLSNNVYRFTAPSFATTQTVQVTADDTDGSTVTRPITFNVFELQGPTANFQFSPSEPFVNQLVTFTSTSIQGGAQITNYEWQIDGAQINAQTSQFTWTFGGAQTFNVRLQVTDANGLQDSITKQVVVSEVPLPQLLLEELGCNKNVVQGYNQYCTALVTSEGSPVQDAQVTFVLQDQTFGTCMTNNNGYCKIEPQVNLAAGTYTVRAEASKSGYQPDNSRTLQSTFTVWEYRYDVEQLRVFSDEFVTESDTFYRSDPMYVSFRIRDSFTGQLVTDNDLVKEVFLRVLNQNELHFEEHTHTATEYRYFLPSIPITSDFLGEGKVFSFVFNFNDNTAGQNSVVVNVLNNPLQLNLPDEIEITAGSTTDIDFKPFVFDVETSPEDILFSFGNLGSIEVEHIGNNVFRFTAPIAEFTQLVSVTADDGDGSVVTDQTTFVVKDTLGLLGPVAILKLPGSTYEGNTVLLDGSESYPRSGQIVSYRFEITRFGEQVGVISTTEDKINFEFTQRGRHEVTLIVLDDQGRTGSVTHSIDVGRNNPDIVVGDFEGLHISNIVVYGVDDGILDIYEPYTVYATITNHRDERIENLRVKFEIPELGFKAYGSSFNLNPGQSMQRSVVGYLPFDEMDLFQDDFIVTVGVFGSGFSRNRYIPVDIVVN